MHKLLPLLLLPILLGGCSMKLPWMEKAIQAEPLPQGKVCPSWKDAMKGRKAKVGREIIAAPPDAAWPIVLTADQGLKDQLIADGCKPVNG